MKTPIARLIVCGALVALMITGCATKYDYTNFRTHPPRSILVLPPLNESTDVGGTYGYLTTVTKPIAEMGYYVYPVAVVDNFYKENGMPTAGEMHQAPLDKIREIIGADAVLYITLKQYGTFYQLIRSTTKVTIAAKLIDVRTGTILWEGTVQAKEDSASTGNLIGDAIVAIGTQAVNKSLDHAHVVSRKANAVFAVPNHGFLYGPYNPKFGKD